MGVEADPAYIMITGRTTVEVFLVVRLVLQ